MKSSSLSLRLTSELLSLDSFPKTNQLSEIEIQGKRKMYNLIIYLVFFLLCVVDLQFLRSFTRFGNPGESFQGLSSYRGIEFELQSPRRHSLDKVSFQFIPFQLHFIPTNSIRLLLLGSYFLIGLMTFWPYVLFVAGSVALQTFISLFEKFSDVILS